METKKFRSEAELLAVRKKHFLPTATVYHKDPIQLVKAEGVYVWDSKGKKYLDAIGGIVCISVGHNHAKIKRGLQELLDRNMIQHTSQLYLNEQSVGAAEALIEEAPRGLDRVAFTNSGSEANELAFMAARNATGETFVINLRHSYHGGTSGTLAQCGHSSWRFKSQPVANATSALEPYCYRCPFGQAPKSCNLECAKNVETTIQTSTNGKLAAFIAEPVMGVGGFITPPDGYFSEVTKIVHNYGGLYISDEVQTGAGRCGGSFLLTKSLGIDADMVTMAKGLGNGAPVGAVLMKTEVAEKMAGKSYFNTFAYDPYQSLQMQLTVEIIREEKLAKNAVEMGALLKDGLEQMMKTHKIMGDVRGRGLLLGVELVKDRTSKVHATEECIAFMDACKDRGLLLGKGGLKGNVVRLAPPISINRSQVEEMLKIMDQAFSEISKN